MLKDVGRQGSGLPCGRARAVAGGRGPAAAVQNRMRANVAREEMERGMRLY